MKKSIVIRIAQVVVGFAILWMIFALKVAWSTEQKFAASLFDEHQSLLKEKAKTEKLQAKLDSLQSVVGSFKK